jgi:hypothetical protein
MAAEHRLDLPQLDAEAADLDLMVDAAQILDVPGPKGLGMNFSAVNSGRFR